MGCELLYNQTCVDEEFMVQVYGKDISRNNEDSGNSVITVSKVGRN